MKFSIIIPTRNRYPVLDKLIASINDLDYRGSFETVITDQSDVKRQITPPRRGACLCLPMERKGAAASRNHAIRHARGDYLLFVDDDAVFEKDSLSAADRLVSQYPGHACICGLTTLPDGRRAYSRHAGDAEAPVTFNRFECCLLSSMIVKREAMLEAGLFDEQLGIGAKYGGSEESDLVLRLLERNEAVMYSPAFRVRHPDVDARKTPLKQWVRKHYTYGVGRGAMLRKHWRAKPRWALYYSALSLLRPMAGLLAELLRLRPRSALRYAASAAGRIRGFISYKP